MVPAPWPPHRLAAAAEASVPRAAAPAAVPGRGRGHSRGCGRGVQQLFRLGGGGGDGGGSSLPLLSRALFVAACALPLVASEEDVGSSLCKCISYSAEDSHGSYVKNGKLMYRPVGGTVEYEYPLAYGSRVCKPHDAGLPPVCNGKRQPELCDESWCYVEKSACDKPVSRSVFFPGVMSLYFSYATCGGDNVSSNSYDRWVAENRDPTTDLVALVQGYLHASQEQIEEAFVDMGGLGANFKNRCLEHEDMCNCVKNGLCKQNTYWKRAIDLQSVGTLANTRSQSNEGLGQCLSQAIGHTYLKVAAKEGDAQERRVGSQYFGDQLTGSYVNWPNIDWCPSGYDPRYRPWYAAASTGAKDVVIVVDVSASMSNNGRHELAKKAAKAIVDTLTWKDFLGIVLFDGAVDRVFHPLLVPVTEAQRNAFIRWIDAGEWTSGGTDFRDALFGEGGGSGEDFEPMGAFQLIKDSVKAGATSMCQKVIMFLTDGQAAFDDYDFESVKAQATKLGVTFFTYALGSDADTSIMKRLACDNGGIFYKVGDNEDLAVIMADYYRYFASGQRVCTASFVNYIDAITGQELYSGCQAIYDRTTARPSLLGVTCQDMDTIAPLNKLQESYGWREMVCKASEMSKICRHLSFDADDCLLEHLRANTNSPAESVCGDLAQAQSRVCQCEDPSCTDDPDFIDEKGYFCDTWVGDDCNKASKPFGYSAAGQAAVKEKCKRSCGLCAWQACANSTSAACSNSAASVPKKCRACMTEKVSGVDIEGCRLSCADSTSNLFVENRVCDAPVSQALVAVSRSLAWLWLLSAGASAFASLA